MKSYLLIFVFSIFPVLCAETEKAGEGAKEKDANPDDSIIVNKDGLNEDTNGEGEYVKNPIKPPKDQESVTLEDVATEAKDAGLGAVSFFALYADSSRIKTLPESVFQIAEHQLENATKTDEQLVTFGPELEGSTEPKDKNEDDEGEKEPEKEDTSSEEPTTSEGDQAASPASAGLKKK